MDGERLRRERAEIAAKRQRGAALQAQALRLFEESDEQERALALPPSNLEQGMVSDRLSNFDDLGNRIRPRS